MSYGEADLVIEGRQAGNFRLQSVSAGDALGPRLVFAFGCTLTDLPRSNLDESQPVAGYQLNALAGEVRLQENGRVVGVLTWLDAGRPLRSVSYADTQQLRLVCDLDLYRLERLEEHRAGAPLTIWIQLWPTVAHEGSSLQASLQCLRATVPRDDWITVINRLRPDSYELVELRADLSSAEAFRISLGETRKARRLADAGDYDAAVAACRTAIEQLAPPFGAGASKDATTWKERLSCLVGERQATAYVGMLSQLKALGNVAIHKPGAGVFGRQEALFVIRVTENAIALLGALSVGDGS